MDAIFVRDLRIEVLIGIHKRERHVKQTLSLDLDIGLPGTTVFSSDKVADTIDYERVAARIRELAAASQYRLVETFAERVASILLKEFGAPWCKVSAAKLGILANTKLVGVTIERKR